MKKTPRRTRRAAPETLDELKAFFWSKTQPVLTGEFTGCVEWVGAYFKKSGLPKFKLGEQGYYARRTAYELAHELEVPAHEVVIVTCKNKKCVKPDHLKARTRKKSEFEYEVKKPVQPPEGTTPLVIAQERRKAGDPAQLSWDSTSDPEKMVKAIMAQPGFGVLPGPNKLCIELAHRIKLKARLAVQPMHQLALANVLLVASRILRGGDVPQTLTLLQPTMRQMGVFDSMTLPTVLAETMRTFYPSAPVGWV